MVSPVKIIGSVIGAAIVASVFYSAIRDQYVSDHRPVLAQFKLLITSYNSCTLLPPYPKDSQLILIGAKIDNSGAPSVAKDWSLIMEAHGKRPIRTTFFSIGDFHGRLCEQSLSPDEAMENKTESKEIIGITRGQLAFIAFDTPVEEVEQLDTYAALSVLDKDGRNFSIREKLRDIGPLIKAPPSGLPPSPALPGTPERTTPQTSHAQASQ